MAVRHVFMWRVADGGDPDGIIELLTSLQDRVPGIVSWSVGRNQAPPNENGDPWDGALISDHESWEALDEYSNHPYHDEVVAKLLPQVSERAVCDWDLG
jgi:hypothetical protein